MYLAQGEADLHKIIVNGSQFVYRIKTTGKWRCKLDTSCGIAIDCNYWHRLLCCALGSSAAPMFSQVLFVSWFG